MLGATKGCSHGTGRVEAVQSGDRVARPDAAASVIAKSLRHAGVVARDELRPMGLRAQLGYPSSEHR